MSDRLLILAEGYSADPHYSKTMSGVLRYRREDVVVVLDSERVGETRDGVPVVGAVGDALAFAPTAALVGVATQGGRLPAAWRELLKDCIRNGLTIENGLHQMLGDDAEMTELAAQHGVALHDLRRAARQGSTARAAPTSRCRPRLSSPSVPTARSGR